VDNASTEKGTRKYFTNLKKEKGNVILHFNKVKDNSISEGDNVGLGYAKSEYVLLLNNDILIPKKGWLKKMVKCLESDPKVALVCPKLLYPNDTIQFGGLYLRKEFLADKKVNPFGHIGRFMPRRFYSQNRDMFGVTFSCVLARREPLGTLNERYKLGAFDDNDKCIELRKKGFKSRYCGEVELYHYETATLFSGDQTKYRKQYYLNSVLFKEKWREFIIRDNFENPSLYRVRSGTQYEALQTVSKYPKSYGIEMVYILFNEALKSNAKIIIDDGTGTIGTSGVVLARAAIELNAKVISLDIKEVRNAYALSRKFGVEDIIEYKIIKDLDYIKTLTEPVDFVFLDAHMTPDYNLTTKQLEGWDTVLRKGGVLLMHDIKTWDVFDLALKDFLKKHPTYKYNEYPEIKPTGLAKIVKG